MKNVILWTDFHSNPHHEAMPHLYDWYRQSRELMDFWPIAYYPYGMRRDSTGLGIEDLIPAADIKKDWTDIQKLSLQAGRDHFPFFMGYEWQGSGEDGDHNVFFLENSAQPAFPLRYQELRKAYADIDCIAIPHHLAYGLGHRGKNWETQNDHFSPFAEIYSSHGCSENDEGPIAMNRHVHMGPRTDATCAETGWNLGRRFGVIAAGDNHIVPGVFGYGYTACISSDKTKKGIWEALNSRHVYGVTHDKIKLSFHLGQAMMGDVIQRTNAVELSVHAEAGSKINRLEIIADNQVIRMVPHLTYSRKKNGKKIRFKFKLDCGWGPDVRVFSDIKEGHWTGTVSTTGKMIDVEKCWSTFGQKIEYQDDHSCRFELTSHANSSSGKWMGSSSVTTEGFIFEIEDTIDSVITVAMNGKKYQFPIMEMLNGSQVIALMDEAKDLLKSRYGFTELYRDDPWWHNAYKFKLSKAVLQADYTMDFHTNLKLRNNHQIRVRVYEDNGACAWSSPIFVEG